MKRSRYPFLILLLWSICSATGYGVTNSAQASGETTVQTGDSRAFVPTSPSFAPDRPSPASSESNDAKMAAIWPFAKNQDKSGDTELLKPKSTRKAFFLSLLLPGLGEYYVGSKRGIAFIGVEAAAWWMYTHYTSKGNDIEDEFEAYADSHWRYSSSSGEYSYVEWLADKLRDNNVSDADLPRDYATLASNPALMDSITQKLIDKGVLGVSHALPSTKTQQYYEMIGKYPQFSYGWEDITGYTETKDSQGNTVKKYHNAAIVDQATGKANGNYDENISNIASPMRDHYEDLRYDSNQNLKRGQNGIKVLILNRIVSAIDAGRLAYHHNKGLESELSMVRVNFVNKQILDNSVPMLMFTKKF